MFFQTQYSLSKFSCNAEVLTNQCVNVDMESSEVFKLLFLMRLHKQIPDFSYMIQRVQLPTPRHMMWWKLIVLLDTSPETFDSYVVWGSCAVREISQAFCKWILQSLSLLWWGWTEKKPKNKTRDRSNLWDGWAEVSKTSARDRRFSAVRCSAMALAVNSVTLNFPSSLLHLLSKANLFNSEALW